MVNYLYDLDRIEASHEEFKQGEVARSRTVHTAMQVRPSRRMETT